MSREFYQAIEKYHSGLADDFTKSAKNRHVECRITGGTIYVYLFEGDTHVQTQEIEYPDKWDTYFPSDKHVREFVHRNARIGKARITTLTA